MCADCETDLCAATADYIFRFYASGDDVIKHDEFCLAIQTATTTDVYDEDELNSRVEQLYKSVFSQLKPQQPIPKQTFLDAIEAGKIEDDAK